MIEPGFMVGTIVVFIITTVVGLFISIVGWSVRSTLKTLDGSMTDLRAEFREAQKENDASHRSMYERLGALERDMGILMDRRDRSGEDK